MGGARSVEMSRHNSLYVDVMAIENIIAAIDRAEEQLFSAIDSAMAYNVPSGRGDDDQPSAAPVSQPTAEPVERMNAYDQLAARVESEAHRKKPSAASGAVGKNSAAAAPVERETQRKKPGTRPVEAGRVIDVDGDEVLHVKDIRNDVQVLGAASASGRKEWKPTAEPAKSSLSKRTPAPVDMVGEPPKAALTMAAPSERAQPNPKRGESGSKSEVKPMRSMSAGTSAPTSAPSSAPKKVNPRNHNRHVPGGSSAIPSATLNGASRIPSRVPSSAASAPATIAGAAGALIPPAAPGVMYIPGVCAIGRTLPNGFRETPEGLRPVVTLAQRPKVPLAMRQTLADKLFSALKARDVSDMDAVVDTTLTEQRMYASAKDRIEYRSKSMMELARVKRETDVARATQSAMESVSAGQETEAGLNHGADVTPVVGSGTMTGGKSTAEAAAGSGRIVSPSVHGGSGDGSATK